MSGVLALLSTEARKPVTNIAWGEIPELTQSYTHNFSKRYANNPHKAAYITQWKSATWTERFRHTE
jgi:hypothetical protein